MLITELLFKSVDDKSKKYTKEGIREVIKIQGQHYLRLKKNHKRKDVTLLFLREIDRLIEKRSNDKQVNEKVKCKSGCPFCCYSMVTVSEDEAHVLAEYVKDNNIELPMKRLEIQQNRDRNTWRDIDFQDRKCAFLAADNTCSVYEARPGACRKHLVLSNSDFCEENPSSPDLERVFNYEAEVIVTMLWQMGEVGNMADMVVREIKK